MNISVIARFAWRKNLRHTPRDVFRYIVMPVIGMALTGLLWVSLSADALIGGSVWLGIGIVYLVVLTRGFRRKVASFDENDAVTGYNKLPTDALDVLSEEGADPDPDPAARR